MENREIVISVRIDENNSIEVSGKCCLFNPDYPETGYLNYIDIKRSHNLKDYLNSYVSSLILLAEQAGTEETEDRTFSVALNLINPDDSKVDCRSFEITPEVAYEQLREIVSAAVSCKKVKCFPVNVLEDSAPVRTVLL